MGYGAIRRPYQPEQRFCGFVDPSGRQNCTPTGKRPLRILYFTTLPMYPGALIRSWRRCPGRNVRFRTCTALRGFMSLKSVMAPLRRFVDALRLNGHFLPRQRSSALPPLGTRLIFIRSRNIRVLVLAQRTDTGELILGVRGGGVGAAIRIGRVALVALPTPSVAVTVTLNAPAAPKACVTALPEAIPPSPKFQLRLTADRRSVAE